MSAGERIRVMIVDDHSIVRVGLKQVLDQSGEFEVVGQAADARAILSERRAHLDDVKTISAYAKDMRDFLNESELTERRAFIESFVKEIIVMPGDALMRYTVPMPDDSLIPGRATEKVALNGSVLSTVHDGGAEGTRTRFEVQFGLGNAFTLTANDPGA